MTAVRTRFAASSRTSFRRRSSAEQTRSPRGWMPSRQPQAAVGELAPPGVSDERFEVAEIALEGAAAARGEPVLGPGRAVLEGLRAGDVSGLLELPRVHR